MLTVNQILNQTPSYILSVNYDANIGEMSGEETDNEYLAEMTIQYQSLTSNACLSFTVECLVSLVDNKVTIEDMQTGADNHSVYANNIKDIANGTHYIYQGGNSDLKDMLHILIVTQPIHTAPENYTIEAW